MIFGTWHKPPFSTYYSYYSYYNCLLDSHSYHKFVCMFSAKTYYHAFYITGQLCHILKVSFLTHSQVTGSGFVISANIDNCKAIQLWSKQAILEGLSCYELSRDSYYIHGYTYRPLKKYFKVTILYTTESSCLKTKRCCSRKLNPGLYCNIHV